MNRTFLGFALAIFGLVKFAFADEFKSITFSSPLSFRVQEDQFMFIRNFTQEGVTTDTRGVVTVTKHTGTSDVLTAAILDPTMPPEVINVVVIAGPADVTVTCGTAGPCFISYKKEGN